jgi:hypothetical protein
MKRLYLRIYIAVLASLAVLVVVSGVLWSRFEENSRISETIATLALNALPPPHAPRAEQQAALEKIFANLRLDLALYAADRSELAAVGEALPPPAADRTSSGRIFYMSGPPLWAARLADGRWLVARVPHGKMRGPRMGAVAILVLLALAIGIGA